MRRPTKPKRLYIDFDGFFASCEEQADPGLHGRPVGVIPFAGARNSCVLAANPAAKRFGVKTGTAIAEARRLCPRITLTPQRPDHYVRIHRRIIAAVLSVLPIDVVCSIDELAAVLGERDRPEEVAGRIKARVRAAVGERITCSIGCASNRWLAKIAAELEKPDGLTVLLPADLPGPLLGLGLEALPGVGKRMRARLKQAGLATVEDIWKTDPGRLRSIWGSVNGARFWYALHGYAVEPPVTRRGSIGHGRVLPPGERSAQAARPMARQLVVKAARRLRREGFFARRLTLSADCLDAPSWTASAAVAGANDDLTCLGALSALWPALASARSRDAVFRIAVSFDRLTPSDEAQLELPLGEPGEEHRLARLTAAVDSINGRYARTVVGYGGCAPPGGYVGAKIGYGRIPGHEDFR